MADRMQSPTKVRGQCQETRKKKGVAGERRGQGMGGMKRQGEDRGMQNDDAG